MKNNRFTFLLATLVAAVAPAVASAQAQADARAQMMAQMPPEARAQMMARMSPEMRERMMAQMSPEMRAQMMAGMTPEMRAQMQARMHAEEQPHASASAAGAARDDALFKALGGKDGIRHVVEILLDLSTHDTRIAHTFKDVDMEHLSMRLQEQLCHVSGGPCEYKGKDMKVIHEDLKINRAQFNALVEDLQTAMDRQGIASRWQNKLLALLAPMHRDVETR